MKEKMNSLQSKRKSSLKTFENLRLSATNVQRSNNFDVVTSYEDNSMLGFCHIPIFVPTHYISEARGVVGALLAMKHLNDGNGSVVYEVDGLNKRCNIRFTAEVIDTEASERTALNKLIELENRQPAVEQLPCAFLGASRTATSAPMALINGIQGYPQLSHYATGSQLDDKSQYTLFGRVIPSDDGTAVPFIQYLKDVLHVSHFGIIYTPDSYALAFTASLEKAIKKYSPDMTIVTVEVPYYDPNPTDMENAIKILANSELRHFFGILNNDHYELLMLEAYKQGITGPGYNWIFSDSMQAEIIAAQEFEDENSPLAIASTGVSIVSAQGGVTGMPVYDNFLNAWNKFGGNEADIAFLESKMPGVNVEDIFKVDGTDLSQLNSASFLYDAAIAIGLGACNAEEPLALTGEDHYHNILNTSFWGSSGEIVFESSTGSRDPTSALFMFTNIQPTKSNNGTKVTFNAVPTDLFMNGKWGTLSPHVFSDLSNTPPPELPPVTVDYNYIGPTLRGFGLLMCTLIILICGLFSAWTYYHRKGKIVMASQPLFLYLICFGTFIMGSSIIPLSIDDGISSQEGCNLACMIFPWLFSTGFCIAFSALFSKTWKLNKLFFRESMRRVQVHTKDVIVPMAFLLVVNVIVLILWTSVSPQTWTRTVSGVDVYGRTISSVGRCSVKESFPFIIAIGCINLSSLMFTLYQAFKARHIRTILGETKYIAMATSSMLLVFVMGIPVMVIAYENPRALYFVEMFIIFIVCISLVLFTFLPKIILQREVKRGNIDMQAVVREFAQQSEVYRSSRKKDRGSNRDISSILDMGPSFRSVSTNDAETNSKDSKDSHKVVQIKENVNKCPKKERSYVEDVITQINSTVEEGYEGDFAVKAVTMSNAMSILKEENEILKKELYGLQQLLG